MITKTDVLIVIPALNEQRTIGNVIEEIKSNGFNCVVVNDCSSDQTSQVARDAGATVLDLPFNLGVGGALRTGFRFACEHGFKAIVQVDADGQHSVNDIQKLIDAINLLDVDMVVGSRFLDPRTSMSVGMIRRLAMRFLARSATRATGVKITDSTSGFRLIQSPLLEVFSQMLPTNYLGDTYEALLAAGRSGYKVVEIPTVMMDRQAGTSSVSSRGAILFFLKAVGVASLGLHVRMPAPRR